ncbi:unnamed protein product [Paramecium octaurelia]|uniref:Uncharacterized protein n=1 Tax=Paramecium octaurelia TaxID=43137 RepID=A0A8S1SHT5_PAROT|nr:unnamed protein product [Paramecium octaurelia]
MNKEKELIENNFYYQDMLDENVEMNDYCLYENMEIVQQPIENKNFTLIGILNQMNLNENTEMIVEEPNY